MIKPSNLIKISEPTLLEELNKEQVYELQYILDHLGYKVKPLDGKLGPITRSAFREFKEDTWQNNPSYIGRGSIEILIRLTSSKEKLELEDKPREVIVESALEVKESREINWSNMNEPIGEYFYVGEVLRWDRRRIPSSLSVRENIVRIVRELDKIRKEWGGPIGITSGYRPVDINRRVGGVVNSRHIVGDAVDIYPIGGNGLEFERFVDSNWYGNLGWGQRSKRSFSHIDMANGKGWKSGGSKGRRWMY